MGGYGIQRAVLLLLIGLFAIYTTVEYLSTRRILAECVNLTALHDEATVFLMDSLQINSTVTPEQAGKSMENEAYEAEDTPHTEQPQNATIGKVTMLYGNWAKIEENRAVLRTHEEHARLNGHSMHVLDKQIMHGMWSKLSYMLMLILEELTKPEESRLKWLFWFDLDIIVMNSNIPLDVFLPPDDGFSHIHVVVTNDHNGLNSGAFFLRVNEWAVRYLVDIIALRDLRPDIKLKYSDQSAQEVITLNEKHVKNAMYVPQRWFNAYRGPRNNKERLIKGENVPDNTIKTGDLHLHFAGKKVKHLIPTYLALAANNSMGWRVPLHETKLQNEIALFWKLAREKADWDQPVKSLPKQKTTRPAVAKSGAANAGEEVLTAKIDRTSLDSNAVMETALEGLDSETDSLVDRGVDGQ